MGKLTHFDDAGRARMVDVGDKPETARRAVASGRIAMRAETLALIADKKMQKGDVLAVAEIAAAAGIKRTSDLIPLCHPVRITGSKIELTCVPGAAPHVAIKATVSAFDRTGVEMEALTAVTTAALTIYDMCKAVDRDMRIADIVLEEKIGGRSGHFQRGSQK